MNGYEQLVERVLALGAQGYQDPEPGHTPGHVAFFRSTDRVLITGDAVLTVNLNSVPDLLSRRHRVSGPPRISTWNWSAARNSVAVLAGLKPDVLAPGHGEPATGALTAQRLNSCSDRLNRQPASDSKLKDRSGKGGRHPSLRGTGHRRLSWTATAGERAMPLPGDDLVASPIMQTTHAVTISAPPAQVWPWLVQTGQGRAGFYSDSPIWDRCVDWYYRLLSREQPAKTKSGYEFTDTDRIVPAWQNPHVGDIIADGPPGTAYYVIRHVEPARSLVLFTDTHLRYLLPARLRDNPRLAAFGEISDSFLLTQPEPGKTRIVRRMRLACGPWPFRAIAVPIVAIWGEAITARNLLRGIKRRAEVG